MKILLNDQHGGFGVSNEALRLLYSRNGKTLRTQMSEWGEEELYDGDEKVYYFDVDRTDPILIEIFEEIGSLRASGPHATLRLVELPDFCEFSIGEYDGLEWVDQTWISVSIEELVEGLSEEKLQMAQRVGCIKIKRDSD